MKPKFLDRLTPSAKPKPVAVADRSHQRSTEAASATANLFPSPQVAAQKGAAAAKTTAWSPVIDDDFNLDNLADASCPWATGYGWGQTLGNEREYYTRYDKNFTTACSQGGKNHFYQGSSINLIAKFEPASYEVWHWDGNGQFYTACEHYDFTSGMLISKQKFLYGRFEIKCKIPFHGMKLWPAFWLYDGGGPNYREIDIFEFEDPVTPRNWLMNVHIAQALDFGQVQLPADADQRNHYPSQAVLSDVSSNFHTYAVLWFPNSITWMVDGVPVRTLAGHSPPLEMNLIINLAIAPWRPAPASTDLPASFEIDYIKVYKSTSPEFLYVWGNDGANKISLWNMNPVDRFVVGDFDGDGTSDLLAFSSNGWSHLMRWDGSNWQYTWGNDGAGKIALWNMNPADRFVVGDFDGNGKSDLLAFSSNGWSHLMRWDGSNWQYTWGNDGAGKIALWNMRADDKFMVGDFDGDGKSELLAISSTGWAHLMKWDGASWQYIWGNDGGATIHRWFMKVSDRFLSGSYDGGHAQLLAMSINGWAHLMKFAPLP
jgi:beta-glucanase (GH16 family)